MMAIPRVVLSCEHAGNEVPEAFARYFSSPRAMEALASHRGWDPGSLSLGEAMAKALDAPLVVQRVSRLLVECNRSLHHPRLFSEFSRGMSQEEREEVVERYWRSHRDRVGALVSEAGGLTVHVGVHTFTPVWKGRARGTDIGLLFDPARTNEARFVRAWRTCLRGGAPGGRDALRIHLNRPYRGWTDGLVTTHRQGFEEARYLGVELEVSQRLATQEGADLGGWMARGLEAALATLA